MADESEVARSIIDWAAVFMRFSLNDFNRHSHAAGLTFGQMVVLLHLHYQGPCEVTRFCDLMQVSRAGASQMIERLVQLGVVRRVEVPGDRRVRRVELTAAGRKAVTESLAAREGWVAEVVSRLSAAERDQVYAAMQALNVLAGQLAPAEPGADVIASENG